MKSRLLALFVLVFFLSFQCLQAQMQNGEDAKDFTLTDLNGETWNLFDLLDQGKTVYLEFSATWCGPCWNYHSGNHLKNLWNSYGPNATDEVFVFFIEGDLNTNEACLYGPSGCVGGTQGNWVSGTPFPIVNLTSQNIQVRYDYKIAYWPTIYAICPQTKKVYLAGQRSTSGQYEYVSSCGMTYDLTSQSDASCYGFNDGHIHIDPVGGFEPYTYTWSNGNSSKNLNNIPAGTYSCTIKDKNHIEIATTEYTIGQNDEIIITNNGITTESCPGTEDGGVSITTSGGSGGFDFQWSNGQNSENLMDVSGGPYTLVVTDADGCTRQQSYTVPVNPAPIADAGIDAVITCAFPSTSLDGTNSEPSGASYLWTTFNGNIVSGANTKTPVVDKEGDYTLTVTFFSTGCTAQDEAAVTEDFIKPNVEAGPNGVVDCVQQLDTLDGSGSQQGNGYTYLWTTPNGNIVSGAATLYPVVDALGTYILRVSNEGTGCQSFDTTYVVVGPNGAQPVSNYDFEAVNLHVAFENMAGGNPTSYHWSFGDGNTSTQENPNHTYAAEGTYTVCLIVTNACGVDTTCNEVSVTVGAIGISVVNITPAYCNNGFDGAIDIAVIGGVPGYTYEWSNGMTTEDINGIPPGTYGVTVTDSNNDVSILSNLTVGYQFIVDIEDPLVQSPDCYAAQNGIIAINVNSNGGELSYAWSHDPELNNSVAKDIPAGEYTVIVTDEQGCSDEVTVDLNQPDEMLGDLQITHAQQGQNNGAASVDPTGGTSPYTVTWSTGETTWSIENLAPGEYSVVIVDDNNCTWGQTFVIDEAVSIGSIPTLTGWSIQPNPATDQFILQASFSSNEDVAIRLRNVVGGVVYTKQVSGNTIIEVVQLSHLSAGTYFIAMRTRDGHAIQKLVIQ